MLGRVLSLDRLNFERPGPYFQRVLSLVMVTAAGLGTLAFEIVVPSARNPFLFFAAVMVTAWYAGIGTGWVSVLCSAFAVSYYLVAPTYIPGSGAEELSWFVLAFAALIACGAVTVAVCFGRFRMEQTLLRAREELEQRTRKQTDELQQIKEKLIAEMTERIRAEETLRHTQTELARAGRMMNLAELTASIAHEINQPLGAVVANGEAARNWLRRSPPAIPKAAESIEAVVMAGVRAAEIIARIRRLITKTIPRQTVIEINDVVSEVLKLARADLLKRNVVVECHLAPGLPSIIGDRIQLQQLLVNLVNNASDAMADISQRNRELTIETRARGQDTVSIIVSDSGHGLADPDASKIFEAFYSTKQGGMGIGLSVCRTIVESHGGTIRAMPRQPHGAILEVDLPSGRAR